MRKQLFLLSTVCVMAITITHDAHARRKLTPNLPSVQIHYEALESLKLNSYRGPQAAQPVPAITSSHTAPPARKAIAPSPTIRKPIATNPSKAVPQTASKAQPKLQWQTGLAGKALPKAITPPKTTAPVIRKSINRDIAPQKIEQPRVAPKAIAPPKKIAAKKPIVKIPVPAPKVVIPKLDAFPPLASISKPAAPKIVELPPLRPQAKFPEPVSPLKLDPSPPPISKLPPLKPLEKKLTSPSLPPIKATAKELPKLPPLRPIIKAPTLPKLNALPPPPITKMTVTTKPAIDITPPKLPTLPPLGTKDVKAEPLDFPELPPLKPMTEESAPLTLPAVKTSSPSMPRLPPLSSMTDIPSSQNIDELPPLDPPKLEAITKPKTEIAPSAFPELPPLDTQDKMPSMKPIDSTEFELPPLPDTLDLPNLPQLPPKKAEIEGELDIELNKPPAPKLALSKSSGLPPLPGIPSNDSLPELPPLPSTDDLSRPEQFKASDQALNIAQKHNKRSSLPPLPGMPQKTETFVKNTNDEALDKLASLDMPDLPPMPVKRDSDLSPADTLKSKGQPATTIAFSQMERAVPLTSYTELKEIAGKVKADETKGVTILAYAYGSDDQSQLAKRAALARMMAIRTFLIEEGGLDNTQINAMTPKKDAQADGKERVDIFIR